MATDRQRVLVTLPLTQGERERLGELMPDALLTFSTATAASQDDVRSADVILGTVPVELLDASPRLAWMHLQKAGADPYQEPGVLAPSTTLTTSVGAYGRAVSEHAFASLLMLMKKLHLYRDDQRAHRWSDEGEVTSIEGASVLVLGAGDLGLHFARLCHGVGAECVALRRHVPSPQDVPPGYASAFARTVCMGALDEELPRADVVACFLPSSPQTRGLADGRFFSLMREGSYFVNAGRGDLVDQEALCEGLDAGHLAGAALDVTTPEPLPEDSRLWSTRNLVVTPHVGGFFHLPVTREYVVRIALDNVARYRDGRPLRNVVAR